MSLGQSRKHSHKGDLVVKILINRSRAGISVNRDEDAKDLRRLNIDELIFLSKKESESFASAAMNG